MNIKDVLSLAIGLIIVGILLPRQEAKELCFKNGCLVKVIWIDGSTSELIDNKWEYKERD